MRRITAKLILAAGILACPVALSGSPPAVVVASTLAGSITSPAGEPVPNAKVSVRNTATGESSQTQTNPSGLYHLPNLPPGDSDVSVSAEGLATRVATVTLAAGATKTLDLIMSVLAAPQGTQNGGQASPAAGGQAPASGGAAEPSLSDLGFSPSVIQGNAQEQARLDKRSHMLKIHQRLGLITTGPMMASIFTSLGAKSRNGSATGRNVHTVLGLATTDLYFTTAYFAIRAPKVHGTPTRGPIRVHKALAWIHGPGMILTPILGGIAYSQESRGEKVHGIAKYHSVVGVVTAGAFGAAILSVSVKF
ncbi:MAG TPA: carboxypeptidase-like regulatory domain-containing protein [Terriglobia bacterium]|nr:carboxypeptidase-like regulatory domain-containing protein [Terriglobia bacterium]